jgi:hypothetical protein
MLYIATRLRSLMVDTSFSINKQNLYKIQERNFVSSVLLYLKFPRTPFTPSFLTHHLLRRPRSLVASRLRDVQA